MDRAGWQYFLIDINPEPWAVGPVGVGRKAGKMYAYVGRNDQLWHFQQAVKEAMGTQNMYEGSIALRLWFWRRRDEYTTHQARTHRKHEADVTNMQKATEDALQGILYANDKNVKDIWSRVVLQGPDVEPMIGIGIKTLNTQVELPLDLITLIEEHRSTVESDSNSWG